MIKNSLILLGLMTAFILPLPVNAGSIDDIKELINLVKATGTTVSFNSNKFDESCPDNRGYYVFNPEVDPVLDVLAICKDQVDIEDADEVWEVLSHEAMHVAQACFGKAVYKPKYHPRFLRELRTYSPLSAEVLDTYAGDEKIQELEAFWITLQEPSEIKRIVYETCLKETDDD